MGYHVRVKICGVTSEADVQHATLAGADAIGLNFHPASPRAIDAMRAQFLLRHLPPFVEAVGVWVDKPLREAREMAKQLGRIHAIQIHGKEKEMASGYPYHYIPAFQVRNEADLEAITSFLVACREAGMLPSAVLVDGHSTTLAGGTGQKVPWDLLAGFRPGVPLILAGGLTPDNVAEAVRMVRPFGVDVASGVEVSPGKKDPDKVRRFIDRARQAAVG